MIPEANTARLANPALDFQGFVKSMKDDALSQEWDTPSHVFLVTNYGDVVWSKLSSVDELPIHFSACGAYADTRLMGKVNWCAIYMEGWASVIHESVDTINTPDDLQKKENKMLFVFSDSRVHVSAHNRGEEGFDVIHDGGFDVLPVGASKVGDFMLAARNLLGETE